MKLLKEPLLHFLLIGTVIFALYIHLNPDSTAPEKAIVVDKGRINSLVASFERTWNRKPTDAELQNIVDDFVLEEIYYRQALALGIDKNDPMIRRRLRQKMEYLSVSMASSVQPTDGELQSWLDANAGNYRTPNTYSFQQIYINPDKTGDNIEERLKQITVMLTDKGTADGDQTLLPGTFNNSPDFQINSVFGKNFSDKLDRLPLDRWSEPVVSGIGIHFIKLSERNIGGVPSINAVREQVLRDWSYAQDKNIKNNIKTELLGEYQVTVEWPEGSDS